MTAATADRNAYFGVARADKGSVRRRGLAIHLAQAAAAGAGGEGAVDSRIVAAAIAPVVRMLRGLSRALRVPDALVADPVRQGLVLRSVLPLAAIGTAFGTGVSSANPFAIILPSFCNALAMFMRTYSILLLFRIFVSWFPNFNWKMEPFKTIEQITDPFLTCFRGMLPPIAGIDFTPIFGLMFLNWASGVLEMGGEMDPDESVMTAADSEVEAFESLNHFDDSVLENPEFLQDEEDLGTRY